MVAETKSSARRPTQSKLFVYFATMLLVSVFALPAMALGEKSIEIKVALNHIPGVMEPAPSDAPYSTLLAYLSKRSGFKIESEFLPTPRVEQMLAKGQVDCIFPAVTQIENNPKDTIYSETVNVVNIYLFSLETSYREFSELAGETIVYLDRYTFGDRNFNGLENVHWIGVSSQQSALKLLHAGRAQAYMDYYPDLKLSLSNSEFTALQYAKDDPVAVFEDSIECANNDRNIKFIEWVDGEIGELLQSGKMAELLRNYYNQ